MTRRRRLERSNSLPPHAHVLPPQKNQVEPRYNNKIPLGLRLCISVQNATFGGTVVSGDSIIPILLKKVEPDGQRIPLIDTRRVMWAHLVNNPRLTYSQATSILDDLTLKHSAFLASILVLLQQDSHDLLRQRDVINVSIQAYVMNGVMLMSSTIMYRVLVSIIVNDGVLVSHRQLEFQIGSSENVWDTSFNEEMDNIPIKPADVQAIEGLQRINAVECFDDDDDDDECGFCSICLENFGIGDVELLIRMPCKHVFHESCILKWLSTNHVCPLCRFELLVTSFEQEVTNSATDNDNRYGNRSEVEGVESNLL